MAGILVFSKEGRRLFEADEEWAREMVRQGYASASARKARTRSLTLKVDLAVALGRDYRALTGACKGRNLVYREALENWPRGIYQFRRITRDQRSIFLQPLVDCFAAPAS